MSESPQSNIALNSRTHHRTALVLGGGGSTGNAWLIGVVAGLFSRGLDVTKADLIIGTSAGATAAAQVTSTSVEQLYSSILEMPMPPVGQVRKAPVADHLARIQAIIDASSGPGEMRQRMGESALKLTAESDMSAQWRRIVSQRFPTSEWPQQRILITAVEASTGDPVVFDRACGVDLIDAVAASCSSGFAYAVQGSRYIDGGYRTNAENADLATGYEHVLVLSPFGGKSLVPIQWGTHLATQVEELRAGGSQVETVFPGADAENLFDENAMDISLRPAAAQAGYEQGTALTDSLTAYWS